MAVSESSARRYELQDPDVRLMLRVRDGDASAFDELMVRYQNRLVTVLEHLVGRRDQAEDLAQEVFLRVYRARKRYVVGAKFSTWLFTIANHVAANALRTMSRRPEVNLQGNESGPLGTNPLDRLAQAASGQMPARRADRAELCDVVRQALAGLNERQRMAVLLSKFEDMNYAEIATAMEMSPQAIKSLLSRARVNLREVLEPYLENGMRPEGMVPESSEFFWRLIMATRKNADKAAATIEELSAYLDGELDPAGRKRVEQRLAQDPAFRLELQRLERAWGMLDRLAPASVGESFSRSTMAMVTVAATEEIQELQSEVPRQRRLLKIAGFAGLVAAGLTGVVVGHWAWPNPNNQVLHDLSVLEELDLLRHADSIEFLRELDRQGVFPEEPEHGN